MSVSHEAFKAVHGAITMGLIVHAPHPDFGGTLTVGRSAHSSRYEIISHGGTEDVGFEENSSQAAARYFIYQVGKRNALAGGLAALKKAAGG